ncbi:dipeptidase [Sediminivirga luteola]|uniref:dipeptidase n=1 Tax=Sediminivirga luteola TaxID=1774748 RepID=UPI001F57911B|nr:dipeptidase [Sediminivirga luteola]MCI2264045.1 dipeptidase [Sediminivirga luteola]
MTTTDARNDPAGAAGELTAALARQVDTDLDRLLEELAALVAIPSIAWPAFDQSHVRRSAEAVAELARAAGFHEVDILDAPLGDGTGQRGAPAVVARIPAPPGRPTVLLYAHHDVQPPGRDEDWDTPPFTATRIGDRLYGRGAADDKAGVIAHLGAVRALQSVNGGPGVGVTLFIEGEEEAGSPSFRSFLQTHRERLAADAIIVADSSNWAVDVPALTTSLRGMASLEFSVSTLDHALHSGMYGGAAPDAALAMTRLLASLHHADGSVAVPGLASTAPEPEVDFDPAGFRADAGLLEGVEPIGSGSIASRLWQQPALTVTGLDLPAVERASNTLQASVRAKISMRIGPGVDPAEALAALKAHLREHAPFGAHLEFGEEEAGRPWQADAAAPSVVLMRECLADAWGHDLGVPTTPVDTGIGGSIPFIADLLDVFPQAAILVTGVEDPDTRAHSPNESLYLPDFRRAVVAEALFLARSGQGGAGSGTA